MRQRPQAELYGRDARLACEYKLTLDNDGEFYRSIGMGWNKMLPAARRAAGVDIRDIDKDQILKHVVSGFCQSSYRPPSRRGTTRSTIRPSTTGPA